MNDHDHQADAKLDRLLQSWAHDHAADAGESAEMLRQIFDRQPLQGANPDRQRDVAWPRLALGLAASVLVAFATILSFSPQISDPQCVTTSADGSRAGLSKLWMGTAAMFGSQLRWLCDLDGELLLGIDDDGSDELSSRVFVLLTVRERDSAANDWSSVWTGRFVCPLGQSTDFRSEQSESGGSIWVQSRPGGRLVTSHWINWPDHAEISGSLDADVLPGEARVVAEQIRDGHAIQVLQQIWLPDAG